MTESATIAERELTAGLAVRSKRWLVSDCVKAAASGDCAASQRSRGRDESSLTPYYEASGCTIYQQVCVVVRSPHYYIFSAVQHGDCRVIMPRLKVFDLLLYKLLHLAPKSANVRHEPRRD